MKAKTRSRNSSASTPDPATAYARSVVNGDVIAGRYVRLACARHLRDLEDGHARGLVWSPEKAWRAIDFYPTFLRLAEGEHAGEPFKLHPFQQFIIGSIFGWMSADGFRRYHRVYIEAGKGSGKTPLLGGLLIYCLAFDGEMGAHCYVAAVTREQSRVMFEDAMKMVNASPDLAGILDVNVNNIAHVPSGSFIRPVSSEGRSLDAKRVQVAAIDEVHEHRTAVVVDKLSAGMKGRRQGLTVEITNSGFDRETVCWRDHEYVVRILEGVVVDDDWFGAVCGLDVCDTCRADGKDQPQDDCSKCDDWRDERVWVKANPLLGQSVTAKYLRAQVREAINMPSKADLVKRLNFCIWTAVYSRWLPPEKWAACSAFVPDDDLIGVPCFGGLDLGQSDDLCAFARVWLLPDGRVVVRMRYWLPESALTAFPDRPYKQWVGSGLLTFTEGDTTDYDLVETEVGDLCLEWNVRELAYDRRFAEQMAQHLQGRDITMVNQPQGFELSPGLRKIENLVSPPRPKRVADERAETLETELIGEVYEATGKLCHGGDPILAWMVSNVIIRHGQEELIRIEKDKKAPGKKVDGVDALAMALCRAILAPVEDMSKYETPGRLVLL